MEAFVLALRADRLQHQFFRYAIRPAAPAWEPPVDILEVDGALEVTLALPGVRAERIELRLETGTLAVRAERAVPIPAGVARVHRLEIPYGRFERRITLPPGRYTLGDSHYERGCLHVRLARHGADLT